LPDAEQSTQATAFLPQAPAVLPAKQLPPLQQPAQVVGPQLGVLPLQERVEASQVLPEAAQSTQALPPLPQAALAPPPSHLLFLQQPLLQVDGPQDEGPPPVQVRVMLSHFLPKAEQSEQAPPPLPQAVTTLPGWQVLFLQQPVLQLEGPHEGVPPVHLPAEASHFLPEAAQLRQPTPPLPHTESVLPVRHMPALQQPAHLPGPQVWLPPEHAWFLHVFLAWAQLEQVAPPLPQAVLDDPRTHMPA